MTAVGRIAAGSWWRRVAGSASVALLAFGLLAGGSVLLAVAGPRATAALRNNAFHQLVAQTPPAQTDIFGASDMATLSAGIGPKGLVDPDELELARDQMRAEMAALPLAPVSADWDGLTAPPVPVEDKAAEKSAGTAVQLELVYRDALSANVRLVAGRLPGSHQRLVQGAVTVATARRFGLRVGSRLPVGGLMLKITGIVQPADTRSVFWIVDPLAGAPSLVQPSLASPYWEGAVFTSAAAVPEIQGSYESSDLLLTWAFPVDLGRLTAAQAISLTPRLAAALINDGEVRIGGAAGIPFEVTLGSGAPQLLAAFAAQVAAVDRVLLLVSVGLAVVMAAVVLLAAWLLAERRREELGVLRARGASRRQLALAAAIGSAIVSVPAMGVGAVVAVRIVPGAAVPLGWWLAGLIAVVAVAGPAMITVVMHRRYVSSSRRPDQAPGRIPALRRLVAEGGLALAAIGGLAVLRVQGANADGDVYAAAAPVLVSVPVAIVLLRAYPLAVRGILRTAAGRSGASTFVGLARAARVPASAVLPAFGMVLALCLVSFSGMVRAAIVRGEVAASWQEVGADAVISSPAVSRAQLHTIAAVPGVQRVVSLGVAGATYGAGRAVTVAAVNPAQYRALLAAEPLSRAPASFGRSPEAAGPVPVLASAGMAAAAGKRPFVVTVNGQRIQVQVAGQSAAMSSVATVSVSGSGGYLALPESAFGRFPPPPDVLLVQGSGLDRTALADAVRQHLAGSSVVFRQALQSDLESAPLQHGTFFALALGGYLSAAACLLMLALSLLMSAGSRQMTLARMGTMGLSAGQSRRLAVVEGLPLVVAILAGGLGSGLALAPLIGPGLSLAVFTGSTASVPVSPEPGWLAATGAGLLVLAVLTLAGQVLAASRNAPRSLRIGG